MKFEELDISKWCEKLIEKGLIDEFFIEDDEFIEEDFDEIIGTNCG